MIMASMVAEVLVNSRALVVHYQGRYYFPVYGSMIPGKAFGLDYPYETNYRELSRRFQAEGGADWVLMPPIPFNPLENDLRKDEYPPFPPSFKDRHFLGTDTSARDMAARLVYGFRIAIFFSLTLLLVNYGVGVTVGCAMGYWGGKFDLILQRIIEIWTNIPFLYVIIIISSIVVPKFTTQGPQEAATQQDTSAQGWHAKRPCILS